MNNSESVKQKFLDSIVIDNPCPRDWNEMYGDEKDRYCTVCNKHVFNLISMTRDESCELVANGEGSVCLRVSRDMVGNVITSDTQRSSLLSLISRRAQFVAGLISVFGMILPAAAHEKIEAPSRFPLQDAVKQTALISVDEPFGGDFELVRLIHTSVEIIPKRIFPPAQQYYVTGGSAAALREAWIYWQEPKLPEDPLSRVNEYRPIRSPDRI